MKFLNSNYANFARGKSTRRSGNGRPDTKPAPAPPTNTKAAPVSGYSNKVNPPDKAVVTNPRGYNASSALSPANGPQPFYGPQQKKGRLANLKDAVEGKAQYYGAKGKNMLAKAGKFIANNKVGVGLAAAGALGAAGAGLAMRKMRSDKGKKRGNYN